MAVSTENTATITSFLKSPSLAARDRHPSLLKVAHSPATHIQLIAAADVEEESSLWGVAGLTEGAAKVDSPSSHPPWPLSPLGATPARAEQHLVPAAATPCRDTYDAPTIAIKTTGGDPRPAMRVVRRGESGRASNLQLIELLRRGTLPAGGDAHLRMYLLEERGDAETQERQVEVLGEPVDRVPAETSWSKCEEDSRRVEYLAWPEADSLLFAFEYVTYLYAYICLKYKISRRLIFSKS
ncbi:hypothetical protein MSAN_01809300 [Mycena sanguinolenta]|uniref:Uncharacterized protein n=1 Tax=Mycena sanguinolenta TaxID=230812 RepID=A0A8H6XT37_9AGAR|nr:hypothetical protein MSAN_01809300 [Mycena sanguinolenta]